MQTAYRKIGLIEKYRQHLPVTANTPVITLGEGNTPLVQATNIPRLIGYPNLELFFKLEGLNPTGSFKDRGMTLAMSKASWTRSGRPGSAPARTPATSSAAPGATASV